MSDERMNSNGAENNERQSYGQYSYNPYNRNGGYQNDSYNSNQNRQEYHWSFEDYEAAGRKPKKEKTKKRGTVLAVV